MTGAEAKFPLQWTTWRGGPKRYRRWTMRVGLPKPCLEQLEADSVSQAWSLNLAAGGYPWQMFGDLYPKVLT